MKNILLVIAVLFVGACATTPAMESVAGTYEVKKGEDTVRLVLLENGVAEGHINENKRDENLKWKITKEDEIHAEDEDGIIAVYRFNKDKSITFIAEIYKDGKRTEIPKEEQDTLKNNPIGRIPKEHLKGNGQPESINRMIVEFTIKHIGPLPWRLDYSSNRAFEKDLKAYQGKVREWWLKEGEEKFKKLLQNDI